jgi:hypothetical protein
MSRISSHGSVISIQSEAAETVSPIVSATKAKPCVITTSGATPPAVGDIVVPTGTGWASIEGRPFKVSAAAADVITLGDSDTSGEADVIQTGNLNKPTFTEMCRSTFTVNNPAGATIDVTTLCDNAHQIVAGLPAIGTWQANGFYDSNDAAIGIARDYYRSGEIVAFLAVFRDGSGIAFNATVNVFDIVLGINAAITNNLGGQISGLVSMFPAPAGP